MQVLSRSNKENDVVVMSCFPLEHIYNDSPTNNRFCYIYYTLFINLGLCFPLNPFEKEVLAVVNIASTQLYSNI